MLCAINAKAEICYNFDDFLSDFEDGLTEEVASNNNDTVIVNDIKVKADTGGNYADSGEVVEGEARIDIDIESSVNGRTIEDVEITEEKAGDIEVNIESHVETNEEKAVVKTITDINGEIREEEKEIKIEESKIEIEKEETSVIDTALETEEFTNSNQAINQKEFEDQGSEQTEQKEDTISVIFFNIVNAIKDSFLKLFSFFV